MAWINDAHSQWHSIHGKYSVCPLDCGAGEHLWSGYDEEEGTIRCGHCKGRHVEVADVRECGTRR